MSNAMIQKTAMSDLLNTFAWTIGRDTMNRLIADRLDCAANMENACVKIAMGRKFAKVIVGSSVRYFVRLTDGVIFASASHNAPNFNRSFGTLWTINDFNWGGYEARAKFGTPWKMVPVKGGSGYLTAVAV
jgi:hypothetical protein